MPKLPGLRTAREGKFLSVPALSKKAGVSRNTIYLIEQQGADARWSTIAKLVEGLGVDARVLLEEPQPEVF